MIILLRGSFLFNYFYQYYMLSFIDRMMKKSSNIRVTFNFFLYQSCTNFTASSIKSFSIPRCFWNIIHNPSSIVKMARRCITCTTSSASSLLHSSVSPFEHVVLISSFVVFRINQSFALDPMNYKPFRTTQEKEEEMIDYYPYKACEFL